MMSELIERKRLPPQTGQPPCSRALGAGDGAGELSAVAVAGGMSDRCELLLIDAAGAGLQPVWAPVTRENSSGR